eukprot:TRINITY_DN2509_c0_g1_i1.p1 TRINITY_DN2509_c0_g1~~TRINITY_DN2509_c0_g1_i1.p1  ORF type:complete len:2948 (+),score=888.97 TRINITY_DN2509_c0_g1_i1:584-8845(+)
MALLPILAAYDPTQFASSLETVMTLLLDCTNHQEFSAYLSIGAVIEAMASPPRQAKAQLRAVEPYIPGLLASIFALLQPNAAGNGKDSRGGSWFGRKKIPSATMTDEEAPSRIGGDGFASSSGSLQYGNGDGRGADRGAELRTKDRPAIDAVGCLKSLAVAFPERPELRRRLAARDVQAGIFALPLKTTLVTHLNALCKAVPAILPALQERMLAKASMMLVGMTWSPYDPMSRASPAHVERGSTAERLMALRALQDFDLSGHDMTLFAARCVTPLLNHVEPSVRREAAATCWRVLMVSTDCFVQLHQHGDARVDSTHGITCPNSHHHKAQVLSIIRQIVALAVSDVEVENRLAVIRFFEHTRLYDPFVATPDVMRSLLLAVNDECQEITELTVPIIGRLSVLNPACALPALRKVLLQLLTELSCTMDPQRQDLSANMLGRLIRSCPQLIEPYVSSLLSALLEKMQTDNHRVNGSLLFTIGELSSVAGKEVRPLLPKIIPYIIRSLKEKPNAVSVRQAIEALGKLVQKTGYTGILADYPMVLGLLIDCLQGVLKEPFETRLAAMRTIGVIGALDPLTVGQMRQSEPEAAKAVSTAVLIPVSDANYETHAVVNSLLAVLDNPSLQVHHRAAVQALQMILRALKSEKPIFFLPRVLPAFLKLLEDNLVYPEVPGMPPGGSAASAAGSRLPVAPAAATGGKVRDRGFVEFMFAAISQVVSVVNQHIRKYQASIVHVVRAFWDPAEPSILIQAIGLSEELCNALHEEFLIYLAWLLPLMIQVVREDASPDRILTLRVLQALEVFGPLLERFLHLVIPCLVGVSGSVDIRLAVRIRAVRTLKALCQQPLNLTAHAGVIVHALTRVLLEAQSDGASGSAVSGDGGSPPASPDHLSHAPAPGGGGGSAGAAATHQGLQSEAAAALEALMMSIKSAFEVFMPMLRRVLSSAPPDPRASRSSGGLASHKDRLAHLSSTMQKIQQQHGYIPRITPDRASSSPPNTLQEAHRPDGKTSAVNRDTLRRAWQVSLACGEKDHVLWLSQLGQKLLRESPSPSLRAAFDIARQYPQLNHDLFNVAFVSCYFDLAEKYRSEMLNAVDRALHSENLPPEVLQPLLNLAEYLERCDRGGDTRDASRSIMSSFSSPQQLASLAEECQLYAKALHYHETTVRQIEGRMKSHPSPHTWPLEARKQCFDALKSLVHVNNCLELPESSEGILKYIKQLDLDESTTGLTGQMYAHLGWWERAYETYKAAQGTTSSDDEEQARVVGMFKCLDHMGDWHRLLVLASEHWVAASKDLKKAISPMVAHAAWLMSSWTVMDEATRYMDGGELEATPAPLVKVGESSRMTDTTAKFYRAVLAFHRGEVETGRRYVRVCREMMDTDLSTQVAESYGRAYELVVCLQQLTELEEVIDYSLTEDEHRRALYRTMWESRVQKMSRDPKYLQGTLALRALVIPPTDNLKSWLEYVATCRWSKRPRKAQAVLLQLLGRSEHEEVSIASIVDDPRANPRLVLEYLKHHWSVKGVDKKRAHELYLHLSNYASRLRLVRKGLPQPGAVGGGGASVPPVIKSKVLLLMSLWEQELKANVFWMSGHREPILAHLLQAVEEDPEGYRAWHEWALLNYRIPLRDEALSHEDEIRFVTKAIEGFTRSIALCQPAELAVQDILRMLRAWFNFGADEAVAKVVSRQLSQVNIDVWLKVIPQVIARIGSPEPGIQRNITDLLNRVAERHPQAVIFPLVVCATPARRGMSKAPGGDQRRVCAKQILDELRRHKSKLVEQAELVGFELIRVAILWTELWSDAVEEASRLYFGANDPHGMIRVLSALYPSLDSPVPQTENEKGFVFNFGSLLKQAKAATDDWQQTGRNHMMTQAWDLYYNVFKRLGRQLQQMSSIELSSVSPNLHDAKDLEVAVPGQYNPDGPLVCIRSFSSTLKVIPSKQRPRRLTMIGSDGNSYKFLLKGHEDLRQDERVMQLFGLVNTLLRHDKAITKAARADLSITKYPVVPLSSNAGIIGWLDRAETLHALIRDYREKHRMQLSIELKHMHGHAGEYDQLSLIQKVEVFEHALANTDGDDLNNILWLRASNSESWLQRRTNFTRSLATMSMVGYILGLGDRHPSNLMLEQTSGKAIHIDFGDCFEVAMQRDKFPEKIPFRLTRMMVRAMEVSGIEGCFRRTSELVMDMLRRNKDSVMAMLEAFVHDPLISWRLDSTAEGPAANPAPTNNIAGPAPTAAAPAGKACLPPTAGVDLSSFNAGRGKDGDMDRFSRSLHEKNLKRGQRGKDGDAAGKGEHNKKAVAIVQRIKQKLDGTDFQDVHRGVRLTNEANIYASRRGAPAAEDVNSAAKQGGVQKTLTGVIESWEGMRYPAIPQLALQGARPAGASPQRDGEESPAQPIPVVSNASLSSNPMAVGGASGASSPLDGLPPLPPAAGGAAAEAPSRENSGAGFDIADVVSNATSSADERCAIRRVLGWTSDAATCNKVATDAQLVFTLMDVPYISIDAMTVDDLARLVGRAREERSFGSRGRSNSGAKRSVSSQPSSADPASTGATSREEAKAFLMGPKADLETAVHALLDAFSAKTAVGWAERLLEPHGVSRHSTTHPLTHYLPHPTAEHQLAWDLILATTKHGVTHLAPPPASLDVVAAEQLLQRHGVLDARSVDAAVEGVPTGEHDAVRGAYTVVQEHRAAPPQSARGSRVRSATKIQSLFRGVKARRDTRMRVLLGEDADHGRLDVVDVPTQVTKLIEMATAHENLAQCYIGWCPFW